MENKVAVTIYQTGRDLPKENAVPDVKGQMLMAILKTTEFPYPFLLAKKGPDIKDVLCLVLVFEPKC